MFDDLRQVQTPDKIASLFHKLGYNARSSELDVRDLELPARSTEAVWKSYLIANQGNSELQVLLFHLHPQEFSSPSVASNRMRAIAERKNQLFRVAPDLNGVSISTYSPPSHYNATPLF